MTTSEHTVKVKADVTEALAALRNGLYPIRYQAINDALWLVQRGPRDPAPPVQDERSRANQGYFEPSYMVGSREPQQDPRYEISLALDIARFLLKEELDDECGRGAGR